LKVVKKKYLSLSNQKEGSLKSSRNFQKINPRKQKVRYIQQANKKRKIFQANFE